MNGIAQELVDLSRVEEYRRTYVRCLRAQRADRWVSSLLLLLLIVAALTAALDLVVNGNEMIKSSRTQIPSGAR